MNTKYTRQVIAIKRSKGELKKVLGVDAWLFVPGENDKAAPLETVGYSRYVMTLIEDTAKGIKVTPKANIPADEVAYMYFRTQEAMKKLMFPTISSSRSDEKRTDDNKETTSIAYTQKLVGWLSGKTPAGLLLENPANKEELLKMKNWLQPNVDRYPGNKTQIEAIDEAITLFEIGELKSDIIVKESSSGSGLIDIYTTEFKYFSEIKDGTTDVHKVYNINIVCDTSKDYPFIVNIQNGYAPVITKPNGQTQIKMSEATDIVKSSILLTDKEWFAVATKMMTVLDKFENITFEEQFEIMKANSYQG